MDKKAYTIKEKALLAGLIREHGAIIENKQTDGSNIKKKQDTWELICVMYNSQPEINCQRSSKQLRKLWDNMKQKKRRDTTTFKYNHLLTGGGPPIKDATETGVSELIDLASPHNDVEITCRFDSTAVYEDVQLLNAKEAVGMMADDPTFEVHFENKENEGCANKNIPSTSTSAPRKFKSLETEQYWRVLKVKEAVVQQRELHEIRMKAAKAELELAELKLKKFHN